MISAGLELHRSSAYGGLPDHGGQEGGAFRDVQVPWLTGSPGRLPGKLGVFPQEPFHGVVDAVSHKTPRPFTSHAFVHQAAEHVADLVGRNVHCESILLDPFPRGVQSELALVVRLNDQKTLGVSRVSPDWAVLDGVFVDGKLVECNLAVIEYHVMREPSLALNPVWTDGYRECGELGRKGEGHSFTRLAMLPKEMESQIRKPTD